MDLLFILQLLIILIERHSEIRPQMEINPKTSIPKIGQNTERQLKSDNELKRVQSESVNSSYAHGEKITFKLYFNFLKTLLFGESPIIFLLAAILSILEGVHQVIFIFLVCEQIGLISDYEYRTRLKFDNKSFIEYFTGMIVISGLLIIIKAVSHALWKVLAEITIKKYKPQYLNSIMRLDFEIIQKANLYKQFCQYQAFFSGLQKAISILLPSIFRVFGYIASALLASLIILPFLTVFLIAILLLAIILFLYSKAILSAKYQVLTNIQSQFEHRWVQVFDKMELIKIQRLEQHFLIKNNLLSEKLLQEWSNCKVKLCTICSLWDILQFLTIFVAFMIGIQCVSLNNVCPISEHYKSKDVISVSLMFGLIIVNLSNLQQTIISMKSSLQSWKKITGLIQSVPINKVDNHLQRPILLYGLQICNGYFNYPQNKKTDIFTSLDFRISNYQTSQVYSCESLGKSTLLKLIFGIYPLKRGLIALSDLQLNEINSQYFASCIGLASMDCLLLQQSVHQNLVLSYKSDNNQLLKNVLQITKTKYLLERRGQIGLRGDKLSNTEKMRVIIARQLLKKPHILLLDLNFQQFSNNLKKQLLYNIQNFTSSSDHYLTILKSNSSKQQLDQFQKCYVISQNKITEKRRIIQLSQISLSCDKSSDKGSVIKQSTSLHVVPAANQQHLQDYQIQHQSIFSVFKFLISQMNQKKGIIVGIVVSFIGIFKVILYLLVALAAHYQYQLQANGLITNWCVNYDAACTIQNDNQFDKSLSFLFILLGLQIILFAAKFYETWVLSVLQEELIIAISHKMFSKMIYLKYRYYQSHLFCRIRMNLQSVLNIVKILTNLFHFILRYAFSVITTFIILVSVDWLIAIIYILTLPLAFTVIFIAIFSQTNLGEQSANVSKQKQYLLSLKSAIMSRYQQQCLQSIQKSILQTNYRKMWIKQGIIEGLLLFLMYFLNSLSIYFIISRLVNNEQLDHGRDVLFFIFIGLWINWKDCLQMLSMSKYKQAYHDIGVILNIFALDGERKQGQAQETQKRKEINLINGKIQFRNVSFAYPGSKQKIFNKLNIKIQAGKRIAIVGNSGVGKTTFLKLILGFYQYQGDIFIDDQNIRDASIIEIRSKIAYISHNPSLLHGTVLQNLSNFENDQPKIGLSKQILKKLNSGLIEADIQAFMQRQVGCWPYNISSQQLKKITLAKAIIQRPSIYLLDEVNLYQNCQAMCNHGIFNSNLKGRTVVHITNSIEIMEKCDMIYFIENGVIIEQGQFEELIFKKNSFYKYMGGKTIFKTTELFNSQDK